MKAAVDLWGGGDFFRRMSGSLAVVRRLYLKIRHREGSVHPTGWA